MLIESLSSGMDGFKRCVLFAAQPANLMRLSFGKSAAALIDHVCPYIYVYMYALPACSNSIVFDSKRLLAMFACPAERES